MTSNWIIGGVGCLDNAGTLQTGPRNPTYSPSDASLPCGALGEWRSTSMVRSKRSGSSRPRRSAPVGMTSLLHVGLGWRWNHDASWCILTNPTTYHPIELVGKSYDARSEPDGILGCGWRGVARGPRVGSAAQTRARRATPASRPRSARDANARRRNQAFAYDIISGLLRRLLCLSQPRAATPCAS